MNRHNLLYLDYNNCKSEVCFLCKDEEKDLVMNWIKEDNPFIITRQFYKDNEKINVGFMLPLKKNKKRVNFAINSSSIKEMITEIRLKKLLDSLDNKWQKPLFELIESFDKLQLDIFVFGSALWQYFTKQKYMHSQSDIDLLWKPKTIEQLEKGLFILKDWMEIYPLKIDGEVILPCQKACSWKELLNDDENVLVKSLHTIYLEKKETFLSSLRN